MAAVETRPVRGFRDLLPDEASRTTALETAAREVFGLYGYGEIRLPTVESRELFIKTTGETTDIVQKEMFAFKDQGDRDLALRPEGTPGAVRLYLNNHLKQHGAVSKLFYIGSMFRAERPQKGRYREFEQIGLELLGNPDPAGDVEAILALKDLLDRAGLEGKTRLKINNLGCDTDKACRPAFRERLRAFLKERSDSLCDSCKSRIDTNPLRALDCKKDGPALADAAPKLEPCDPCRDHVAQVSTLLAVSGLEHDYPATDLVRGLDYYTRTVFEFIAEGLGSQSAVAGGGRYDALVAQMGGPETPAVGWSLGVERALIAAGTEAKPDGAMFPKPAVFVAAQPGDAAAAAEAVRLLQNLRRFGISAGGGLFSSSLKAQLKESARRKASWTVLIGEDELAQDPPVCMVKDMSTGDQERIKLAQAVEALGHRIHRRDVDV